MGDDTRFIVSEPLRDLPGAWNEVPEVRGGSCTAVDRRYSLSRRFAAPEGHRRRANPEPECFERELVGVAGCVRAAVSYGCNAFLQGFYDNQGWRSWGRRVGAPDDHASRKLASPARRGRRMGGGEVCSEVGVYGPVRKWITPGLNEMETALCRDDPSSRPCFD